MLTKFLLKTMDVSGECEFSFREGRICCALYKVSVGRPLTPDFLTEVTTELLKEAERVLNNAYISSLSSLYVYQDEEESSESVNPKNTEEA